MPVEEVKVGALSGNTQKGLKKLSSEISSADSRPYQNRHISI
jgi:hypothetical protein